MGEREGSFNTYRWCDRNVVTKYETRGYKKKSFLFVVGSARPSTGNLGTEKSSPALCRGVV